MCWNVSVAGKCQAWMTPALFWPNRYKYGLWLWSSADFDLLYSDQEVGINLKAEWLPEG